MPEIPLKNEKSRTLTVEVIYPSALTASLEVVEVKGVEVISVFLSFDCIVDFQSEGLTSGHPDHLNIPFVLMGHQICEQ